MGSAGHLGPVASGRRVKKETTMKHRETARSAATHLVERFNPITGGPSTPLKTRAVFGAFGPSLMPRATMHQGIAAGLSLLAGEVVGRAVDAGIR